MNDHDVTAVLERLIEPLNDEVGSWDDVLRRAAGLRPEDRDEAFDRAAASRDPSPTLEPSRARDGRWRHRRGAIVLAAAALVVAVASTSALGTVRGLLPIVGKQADAPVFNRVVTCYGARGNFVLRMARPWTDRTGATSRRWEVASGTGQYAQVAGAGRWRPDIVSREGSEPIWIARLWGYVTSGGSKQRVLITLEGLGAPPNAWRRPGRSVKSTFVLKPLQRGPLKPDSGSQRQDVFG